MYKQSQYSTLQIIGALLALAACFIIPTVVYILRTGGL